MLADVIYSPGTQKEPQQTKLSELAFTDTDHVHFPNGRLSTLPPYNAVSVAQGAVQLIGAVRADHAFQITGTYAGFYELYGAHNRLYARNNGTLYNITPIDAASNITLGTDLLTTGYDSFQTVPFGTTSGSKIVSIVTFMTPFLQIGDIVTISNVLASVNGIPAGDLNGAHTIINFDGSAAVIQVNTAANATGFPTLGANPNLAFKKMQVTHTAHGLVTGDRVKISGATGPIGGVPAADINIEHEIVVSNANEYGFMVATTPTSFANGGGAAIVERRGIAAGSINQGTASGFGAGVLGAGVFGIGGTDATTLTYPRIWSIADFGNTVVMCPGDYTSGNGQKIYIWDGNLAIAPTVLTNAPTDCNWVAVVNNSVVALCGTTIKISQLGDATVWNGLSYFSVTVQQAWKLISCHNRGDKDAVIFTPSRAYLLQYIGGQAIWDVTDLGVEDGILSPYSAALDVTTLRWRGQRGSYSFDGSPVKKDYNAQNEQWIINNINYAQVWKSFAFTDTQNSQWYHYFPTGTDTEPGDYAIYNHNGNLNVTLGRMQRTAAQRPGFINSQFVMIDATSATVPGTIYRHFVNGPTTFNWSASTALFYIADGAYRYLVDQFLPDSSQTGAFNIQMVSRPNPQGAQTVSSAYPIDATTDTQTVKAAGRVFGIIFSGSSVGATIGAWKMHFKQLGKR